jgi:Kef-type K+ transport system membrane component KefB
MRRNGQPAVIGQLLAGFVFGTIWPAGQEAIFPSNSSDRQTLNAVSELGVLLLLLLTGMETDLALVRRVRRTAVITSAAGIVIPFVCGYVLGAMLPDSVPPDPNRLLLTSLFLATALSVSSVKIVAAASARWTISVVISARSSSGQRSWMTPSAGRFSHSSAAWRRRIVIGPVLFSVLGMAAFLVFCFTIGRPWVARIIRWTNDHFVIEMPVISVILVIMIALAGVANFIGVHTVLGAFAAGIMIGQSPILTKHIEEQLRGLIVAFYADLLWVVGLAIDLKVLSDPDLLGLALILIGIASIGKLGDCYLGSRVARLNHPEALAVASP